MRKCAVKSCPDEVHAHYLCQKHYRQASRLRKAKNILIKDAVNQVVEQADSKADSFNDGSGEITELNADSKKTYWDAVKQKESALKLKINRDVDQGRLAPKNEIILEASQVVKPIWERFEKWVDDLPKVLSHKSDSQVRGILKDEMKVLQKGIVNYLKAVPDDSEELTEFWNEYEKSE